MATEHRFGSRGAETKNELNITEKEINVSAPSHVLGNNPHNNKIHIDFKANRIWFEPVGMKSLLFYWLEYFCKLVILSICTMFIPVVIAIIIQLFNRGYTMKMIAEYMDANQATFGIIYTIIVLSTVLVSLQYFNKYWRDNYYPKVASLLFIAFEGKHKFIVNPDSGEYTTYGGYRIVLPHFKNVYLDYNMTGDYAEFLSDIKVEPIYKGYAYTWNAHFIFSQVPTKGKFEVSFI